MLNVEWLNKEIDFGLINETDGKQTGEFRFVNKEKKPVEISFVKASCGCTDATFQKGKVSPGDTAYVKVAYDPEDRPGKFDKVIRVFFEKETAPVDLEVKGTVMASPETISLFFPYGEGDLHFETDTLKFGELPKGVRRRDYLDIYNSGRARIMPEFESDSEALTFTLSPEVIEPGESGTLSIILDSSRLIWTGEKTLKLKGKLEGTDEMEIVVTANVLPPSKNP